MTVDELRGLIQEAVRDELLRNKNAQDEERNLMTIPEICARYGFAEGTLRKILGSRAIPSFKRGKRVWIDRQDIEEYIRNGKRRSTREIKSGI